MGKVLVIGDVHHKIELADKILAKNADCERVYWLGDYFDDFGDNVNVAELTARWLKKKLQNPNHFFCLGNHDLSYFFPENPYAECPGFAWQKSKIINEILKPDDWVKFQFYFFVDGWLLTHAGVSPRLFKTEESIQDFMERNSKEAFAALRKGSSHSFYGVGYSRGGNSPVGGVTWLDFEKEFKPIDGVKQCAGHSPDREPRWKGDNVCIDTFLNYYAIIEDGKLTVHKR